MANLTVSVSARDSGGLVGTGSATITTTPASGNVFPMSFSDPMFVNMTNVPSANINAPTLTLGPGQSVNNKSFSNNTNSVEINCGGGGNAVTLCRTFSREGIRISEGGNHTVDRCWIETYGRSGDHADGIQFFPANNGNITIKNSTLRSWSGADTNRPPLYQIPAVGIFYSDGYQGNITFTDDLFWGGQHAFRIHCDVGGVLNIRFNRLRLVGPFGSFPWEVGNFGGTINILEWNDVRNATIVNGVVVPDSIIPPP